MMAQEPWCQLPKDFAELTDWQIVELYYKPAVERAKQFRQGSPGHGEYQQSPPGPLPTTELPHPPVDSPLFKDWFIRTTASMWGLERAKAEYEIQSKEYREAPPDAWWRVSK